MTAWFEWGPGNYGNVTPVLSLGSGLSNIPVTAALTGLVGGQNYSFHIRATNYLGNSVGTNLTFAWNSTRPSLQVPARPTSSGFSVPFTAVSNQVYWMEATTNIGISGWSVLGPATDLGNGTFRFIDSLWTNYPTRYYRVFAP